MDDFCSEGKNRLKKRTRPLYASGDVLPGSLASCSVGIYTRLLSRLKVNHHNASGQNRSALQITALAAANPIQIGL